jgi:3-hydroxyacyl-CoA dehydrogenase
MLIRAIDRAGKGDPFPWIRSAFEHIGFARVSTSAEDARRLGYLRDVDPITMNRERAIAEAKAEKRSIACAKAISPPAPRTSIPVGGADLYASSRSACICSSGRAHYGPRRARRPEARLGAGWRRRRMPRR